MCAAVDTASDPRAPTLAGIVEAKDVAQTGLSWLHSAHCLGSGEIMISTMVCMHLIAVRGAAKGKSWDLHSICQLKGTGLYCEYDSNAQQA